MSENCANSERERADADGNRQAVRASIVVCRFRAKKLKALLIILVVTYTKRNGPLDYGSLSAGVPAILFESRVPKRKHSFRTIKPIKKSNFPEDQILLTSYAKSNPFRKSVLFKNESVLKITPRQQQLCRALGSHL
jgi:hypothetical protein